MIKKFLLTTLVVLASSCANTKELASNPVTASSPQATNFYAIRWKYCVSSEEIKKLGFYPFSRQQPHNCWTDPMPLIVWGDEKPEVELWRLPNTNDSMLNPVKYDDYALVFRGRGCATYHPQPNKLGWYRGGSIVTFNRQYTNQTGQIQVTNAEIKKVDLSNYQKSNIGIWQS